MLPRRVENLCVCLIKVRRLLQNKVLKTFFHGTIFRGASKILKSLGKKNQDIAH